MINNFSPTAKLFLKGFAQNEHYDHMVEPSECHGEFIAIITDLIISAPMKVKSASMNEGQWILEGVDGETYTMENEPKFTRRLRHGKLVKNFKSEYDYEEISKENYDEAIKEIESGNVPYRMIGFVDGRVIGTSSVVKFWVDSIGKKHGMTKSGSHYVFD